MKMQLFKLRLLLLRVILEMPTISCERASKHDDYRNYCSTESGEYILDTPGCGIPNFNISFADSESSADTCACARRQIYVSKINSGAVQFNIKGRLQHCCYSYVQRSVVKYMEDKHVKFSPCVPFHNRTVIQLQGDFIRVRCGLEGDISYEDFYAFIKKVEDISKRQSDGEARSWNVLVLGLDGVSRARACSSLPRTVEFIHNNGGLDFRGYNKVHTRTIPNMMAVLTGSANRHVHSSCHPDMSACNHRFIWHQFKRAGYITAYAEDSIHNAFSTFQQYNGFSTPPTDHYLRPILLAAERRVRVTLCTGHISSGEKIVKYVLDLADTYEKFFGFFWISSFSHDLNQSPKNFDGFLKDLFIKFKQSGILDNTFVILFSDHGIRFGPIRYLVESYYEDRLPMFFMSAPSIFKDTFPREYSNLKLNQHRLISPFDLYFTLWDLAGIGERNSKQLEECPTCQSLLKEVTEKRTCRDAGIGDLWCSCRVLEPASLKEYGATYSFLKASTHMRDLSVTTETSPCTYCQELTLKSLRRIHTFYDVTKSEKFYVVVIDMVPGDVIFEVWVSKRMKNDSYTYEIYNIDTLSPFGDKGMCAKEFAYRFTCVCLKDAGCLNI